MRHLDPAALAAAHVHGRTLPLRAGTRGSPLALVQTRSFLRRLAEACPGLDPAASFAECVIRTTGDAVQTRELAEIGGKGLFAKEIHEALLAGRIDLAVHSLKDLDTELPPGIAIACVLPREDARDALILGPGCDVPPAEDPFACLPQGAVIGTCSVRRQAQLLHRRPDLRIAMMRGNVQTRLAKLSLGGCDASLLALAGLNRLGIDDVRAVPLSPEVMLPAAGQGIIAITVRADDAEMRGLLDAVADPAAKAAALGERAVLAALDGSCRTPIGAHARMLPDGRLRIVGMVAEPDGGFLLRRSIEGAAIDAVRLGRALGDELRAGCPPRLAHLLFDAGMRAALV